MSPTGNPWNETRSQLLIAGALIGVALIAAACYFVFEGTFPF